MITGLSLQQFRSYKEASFEFGGGVNIIVGPNASGKTNLLEAVLVVARGSSYRVKDGELVQSGTDWARLDAATRDGDQRSVKLQRRSAEKVEKTFEINERPLSRLLLNNQIPVVLFEPDHLLLLSGAPDLRRQYLDDLLEQTTPGYAMMRRHYRRVLSQRNALLKTRPAGIKEQLFVWNLRLSELGGQIASLRHNLTRQLDEQIGSLYSEIAGSKQDVTIRYESKFKPETYGSALLHKLESSTELELARGFTLYGPHRDDTVITLGGSLAETSASRGEVRTLLLSLKLLELQLLESARGARPLLLLDDVFSELDGKRRQALTRFVQDYQTFITTTDADVVIQHFTDAANIIPTSS